MEEIWKDIKNFEGIYQISNLGRVKSLARVIIYKNGKKFSYSESLKAIFKMADGYYGVNLSKNNKSVTKKVARLVAEAFIPNPNNYPEVNHKDENKSNNTASNLEWCTRSYNVNYGTRNKRVGDHYIKKVYQYSLNGELLKVFDSLSKAAKFYNYRVGNLSVACRRVLKGATCCGYFFSYNPLTAEQLRKAKDIKEFYIKHRNRHKDYIWRYKSDMNTGKQKMVNQ